MTALLVCHIFLFLTLIPQSSFFTCFGTSLQNYAPCCICSMCGFHSHPHVAFVVSCQGLRSVFAPAVMTVGFMNAMTVHLLRPSNDLIHAMKCQASEPSEFPMPLCVSIMLQRTETQHASTSVSKNHMCAVSMLGYTKELTPAFSGTPHVSDMMCSPTLWAFTGSHRGIEECDRQQSLVRFKNFFEDVSIKSYFSFLRAGPLWSPRTAHDERIDTEITSAPPVACETLKYSMSSSCCEIMSICSIYVYL